MFACVCAHTCVCARVCRSHYVSDPRPEPGDEALLSTSTCGEDKLELKERSPLVSGYTSKGSFQVLVAPGVMKLKDHPFRCAQVEHDEGFLLRLLAQI